MSQFETGLIEVKNQLNQGNLERAHFLLSLLEPSHKANSREKAHVEGVILMRKGEFQTAIDHFLESSKNYGNHICLLADLAASYYLTGQIQAWLRILDLAEYEFEQSKNLISWQLKASFLITLGKMREEQGALAEALEIYDKAFELYESYIMDPVGRRGYVKSLAQVLRLRSQYGQHKSVSAQYRQLIHHSSLETDWDCAFEVEHALMIFETRVWGFSEGFVRFQKLIQNPLLETQEATLIYSDFVFELLMSQSEVPEKVLRQFQDMNQLSAYEKVILDMAQKKYPTSSEILEWPEKMAPAAHLRLLSLCINNQLNETLHKKFLFIIQSLSQKSINLWVSCLEIQGLSSKDNFTYCNRTQALSRGYEKLDLTKKSAFREVLELLHLKENMKSSDVIKELWNGEENESNLSRLRMRVRRFNSEIEKVFGKKDFIGMSNSHLFLSTSVAESKEEN